MSMLTGPRPLTFSLLRHLSDGQFHSGEVLAEKMGISRASVNNALSEVGEYGVELQSVRGRGYRLLNSPQWLDGSEIRRHLGRWSAQLQIETAENISSSNSLLMQRARDTPVPSGTVLAAEWQRAGRGRLGRTWHAGLGQALTFSVLWRFDAGLGALSGLSLAVGLALVRALSGLGIEGAMLKWPNDVLTGHGKLAGILVEAQGDMLGPSMVVVGIGLNLRLPSLEVGQPVSALEQIAPAMPERNRVLAALLCSLGDVLEDFAVQGFAPLRTEWEQHHAFHQRQVRLFAAGGTEISGIVRGVNDEGGLLLETGGGMQVIHSGELSLREA